MWLLAILKNLRMAQTHKFTVLDYVQ